MRRSMIPVLLLLSLLSTGCSPDKKSIGLVAYNMSDPFVNSYIRTIEAFSDERMEIHSLDAENSQILQNAQIARQLEEGRDLLIINPVDRLSVYAVIKRQKEAGVPVIFFNREPLKKDLDLWEHTYYVGAKAQQSGQLQAQMIMDLFGSDPDDLNQYDRNGDDIIQAIILKGEQGHQDAEIRTQEVLRIFMESGYTVEALIESANWESSQAYDKMEQIAETYGQGFDVVISNNDAMAIGALQRMIEAGYFTDTNGNGKIDPKDENWIPVVGVDGIAEAKDMIEYGYLFGTVLNDSKKQAQAVYELAEYALGIRSEEDLSFPLEDDTYIWIDYEVFTLD